MTVKDKKAGALMRSAREGGPTRDEPPLGSLQAKIAKKLKDLRQDAFAYRVLEQLMRETGYWIDPSQVYGSIYKMVANRYVKKIEERQERRGPVQKIYGLTPEGEAALDATIEYHRNLAAYLAGTGPPTEPNGGRRGAHVEEKAAGARRHRAFRPKSAGTRRSR